MSLTIITPSHKQWRQLHLNMMRGVIILRLAKTSIASVTDIVRMLYNSWTGIVSSWVRSVVLNLSKVSKLDML
jgi:hypothetical protein